MAGNDSNWIFLLLPVLFIGVGALFFYIGLKQFRDAGSQGKWASVAGTVVSADPGIGYRSPEEQRGKLSGCFPIVTYQYVLNNLLYTGNRLGNVSPNGVSEAHANKVAAEYPTGRAVAVYYDPANPQNAVLIPQKAGCGAVFTVTIGGVLLAVGLLAAAGAAYVAMHMPA
jgi:hypothetical protein